MNSMSTRLTTLIVAFLLLCAVNASALEPEKLVINERDGIMTFAETFVGKPYIYAGYTQKGFDCSGFVYFVYKNFNIEVPRTSASYLRFGKEVTLENCKKGDIILFTGTNYNRSVVGHVGIITSEQGEPVRFIHSSSSKKNRGVKITDYINSGYPKRYMGIRRP